MFSRMPNQNRRETKRRKQKGGSMCNAAIATYGGTIESILKDLVMNNANFWTALRPKPISGGGWMNTLTQGAQMLQKQVEQATGENMSVQGFMRTALGQRNPDNETILSTVLRTINEKKIVGLPNIYVKDDCQRDLLDIILTKMKERSDYKNAYAAQDKELILSIVFQEIKDIVSALCAGDFKAMGKVFKNNNNRCYFYGGGKKTKKHRRVMKKRKQTKRVSK